MIKVSLGDLKQAEQGLVDLVDMNLTPKSSITVARIVKMIGVELALLEDQRQKLVREIGTETKGDYRVPEERMQEFHKKIQEMLEVEIDLNVEPITEAMLGNIQIKPKTILSLGPLFKE